MTIGHFQSGVPAGATETLVFDLTAENFLTSTGFSRLQELGSLNPDPNFFEFDLIEIMRTADPGGFVLTVLPPTNIPDTDATWRFLTIEGVFAGGQAKHQYNRVERDTYDPEAFFGSYTLWGWNSAIDDMVDANVYAVRIVR